MIFAEFHLRTMLNQLKESIQGNEELLNHPFVQRLILIIEQQAKKIEELEAEIRMLKEHPKKPDIKPSTLNKPQNQSSNKPGGTGNRHNGKQPKKPYLPIDKEVKVKVQNVPANSIFKGYKKVIIQDLKIERINTLYLLEMWRTPEGKYIYGQLPEGLRGTDFGVTLKSFILYQYHQCHVTQPLLHEQLKEFGIDISTGQINRILTENKESFHQEQTEILAAGLHESSYTQTDDTGARHKGKNGYCTFIGNDFFSYFKSTESKSRINFIALLRGEHNDYHINEDALCYMKEQGLGEKYMNCLSLSGIHILPDKSGWQAHLKELNISSKHAIRIATEGALIASSMAHGINREMAIVSDDAGQFNIFQHGLCWIHSERNLQKVHCYTDAHEKEKEAVLTQFWNLYQETKEYKTNHSEAKAAKIEAEFDVLCQFQTDWIPLEKALTKLASNKGELLLVLKRPEIPIHNNGSERDIREYVKRRKISGSTRSEAGRKTRDAFTSLKKTCRKLKVSFWEFLKDRIAQTNTISNLALLVKQNISNSLIPIAANSS